MKDGARCKRSKARVQTQDYIRGFRRSERCSEYGEWSQFGMGSAQASEPESASVAIAAPLQGARLHRPAIPGFRPPMRTSSWAIFGLSLRERVGAALRALKKCIKVRGWEVTRQRRSRRYCPQARACRPRKKFASRGLAGRLRRLRICWLASTAPYSWPCSRAM